MCVSSSRLGRLLFIPIRTTHVCWLKTRRDDTWERRQLHMFYSSVVHELALQQCRLHKQIVSFVPRSDRNRVHLNKTKRKSISRISSLNHQRHPCVPMLTRSQHGPKIQRRLFVESSNQKQPSALYSAVLRCTTPEGWLARSFSHLHSMPVISLTIVIITCSSVLSSSLSEQIR